MVDFQEPIGRNEPPKLPRQTLNDGELFRYEGPNDFGVEPKAAIGAEDRFAVGMEAFAVAKGKPQLEATGGDCPIITIFHKSDSLGAIVHPDTAASEASDSLIQPLSEGFPEILTASSDMTIHMYDDPALHHEKESERNQRNQWAVDLLNKLKTKRGMNSVQIKYIAPGTTIILDTKTGEVTMEQQEDID